MDHQIGVGVDHRIAHQQKQLQTLLDICFSLVAPLVERFSIQVFHGKPGHASRGGAAVHDAGDIGMIHLGDDRPFPFESLNELSIATVGADGLDRGLKVRHIHMGCQVDRTHAALADQFLQLKRSQHLAKADLFPFDLIPAVQTLDQPFPLVMGERIGTFYQVREFRLRLHGVATSSSVSSGLLDFLSINALSGSRVKTKESPALISLSQADISAPFIARHSVPAA